MTALKRYQEAKRKFTELHPAYVEAGAEAHDAMMTLWAESLSRDLGVRIEEEQIVVEVNGQNDYFTLYEKLLKQLRDSGVKITKIIVDTNTKKILLCK